MDRSQGDTAFFLGVVIGAIVGGFVAALFVPRSGPETREQVAGRSIELKLRAEEQVRKAHDIANETVAKVQSAAQELLQRRPGTDSAATL